MVSLCWCSIAQDVARMLLCGVFPLLSASPLEIVCVWAHIHAIQLEKVAKEDALIVFVLRYFSHRFSCFFPVWLGILRSCILRMLANLWRLPIHFGTEIQPIHFVATLFVLVWEQCKFGFASKWIFRQVLYIAHYTQSVEKPRERNILKWVCGHDLK